MSCRTEWHDSIGRDLFTTRFPNVEKKTYSAKRHIAKESRFIVGEAACKLRKSRDS